jgi:hypothetical protein
VQLGWPRKHSTSETAGACGRLLGGGVETFCIFTNTKTNNQPNNKSKTRQDEQTNLNMRRSANEGLLGSKQQAVCSCSSEDPQNG